MYLLYFLSWRESSRKLSKNPINDISKEVERVIKQSELDKSIKMRLYPINGIRMQINRLTTIHKDDIHTRHNANKSGAPTYELAKFVTITLKLLIGCTYAFIKDFGDSVNMIKIKRIVVKDRFISFDVVYLFTKIPFDDAIEVIDKVVDPRISRLPKVFLCTTLFSF